ncbi:hypothetical protein HPB50_009163 [Hyalomma asiaticum]|uniref:Uncharacterized protein n=1 Tax=Hyalomma asiaticum TaxID=266040 RepID=A0ACB7SWV5_HYAAI|nr:hypothetical protein HPB50_009163 [Hyalomma asiaticum]
MRHLTHYWHQGASSAAPNGVQPPVADTPVSSPAHTLSMPPQRSDESQTAPAAAPEQNLEALAGTDASQQPKPARSRLAAIERVLTPEAAARIQALKNDEQRKAELHVVETRLHRQKLVEQRKLHRIQEQREQELLKLQVQLLEQQLEQRKWHFQIERQTLLLELEKKQQQRAESQQAQK